MILKCQQACKFGKTNNPFFRELSPDSCSELAIDCVRKYNLKAYQADEWAFENIHLIGAAHHYCSCQVKFAILLDDESFAIYRSTRLLSVFVASILFHIHWPDCHSVQNWARNLESQDYDHGHDSLRHLPNLFLSQACLTCEPAFFLLC